MLKGEEVGQMRKNEQRDWKKVASEGRSKLEENGILEDKGKKAFEEEKKWWSASNVDNSSNMGLKNGNWNLQCNGQQ